jgi:hypothetical protein
MYYPFLRGRQFELIALRDLASDNSTQGVIMPIIEPVKASTNNLSLAHNVFNAKQQKAFLIVNPQVGEIAGDNDTMLNFIFQLNSNVFSVAFHYRDNTEYILDKIEQFNLVNCMVLGTNEILANDPNFIRLIDSEKISHVTIEDPDKNRDLKRFLQNSHKQFIRLDDLFERQPRNSNFLNIDSHRFSEEHKYYNQDLYDGFGDFTLLSSEFIDGGSTPRAVVIHFTYMNDRDQIWIRHFTSNTNDTIANVQGKFGEAATKAVNYCRENVLTNSAIVELEKYFDNQHYPGLGTVKKISLKNHLLVVGEYVRNNPIL